MTQGIKMSDGKGGWLDRQGQAKIWNGSSWIPAKVKLWTASSEGWRTVSKTTNIATFDSTWTQSYWGETAWTKSRGLSDSARPRDNKGNNMLQGRFTNPDVRWEGDGGIQGGLMGFNDSAIRNVLQGAEINEVKLYLHSQHWWYTTGGQAVLGTHNFSSWQGRFGFKQLDIARQRYWNRDEGQWITLPNWVGEQLRDNSIKGLVTYNGSADPYYYGYFYGTDDWRKPKLQIKYTK
ncbi:hypothetical protein [Liquorilactobacillus hordei]|uniref:Uncharacterized protein n=1 Tax=Liquorilactobacillus hordei DSM 19519 TaxID=1423759 RepID=A0A0R1MJ55_9LACO|nr:hypothetical protein [Liquorilactobacillus hordei]KRL07942.1 hypothetical protein FC92_GL001009 [Liquorilactobacillus hordei DSM 19519]QYH51113.1 hypothetical protein G6O70_00710 [Liquorilactobacillus hordei DSM 19519]